MVNLDPLYPLKFVKGDELLTCLVKSLDYSNKIAYKTSALEFMNMLIRRYICYLSHSIILNKGARSSSIQHKILKLVLQNW